MGTLPSNPELLDWLATEFVRQGWSVKQMHRLIMTSETYKMQSGFANEANLKADVTDTYLWRFPVHRLESEIIRDATLSASGTLNPEAGGEPFFPAIPASLRKARRQYGSDAGANAVEQRIHADPGGSFGRACVEGGGCGSGEASY
jgi:hypothetical protein